MDLLSLLALAIGFAMDAFAVSISIGLAIPKVTIGRLLRPALLFGGFQALMPVIGWLAGQTITRFEWVAAYDHWIAFVLLAGLGVKMIYEARFLPDEPAREGDPTVSFTLVVLAIATSLDALAGGMSLALLRVTILGPALVIGLVAGLFTMAGVYMGRRVGHHLGSKVEIVGGLALIAIGTRILIEHLLSPALAG
ncbi:putative manganese efflux pump MntP [compost metagenome]